MRQYIAVGCLALLGSVSTAQGTDRVAPNIDGTGRLAVVPGTLHHLARSEFDQGLADGNTPIRGASIVFKLSVEQQADLDGLLARQAHPASSDYRKWLTPEQYADRFGMTQSDIGRVTAWLESKGFRVDSTSRSRTRVSFTGTAAQVSAVFHTEMHWYDVEGERHLANSTDVSVPSSLSAVVLEVRNLNDFRPKPRYVRSRVVTAEYTSSSGIHYLAPDDFATIYDIQPLYSSGFDGTGESIAVVGETELYGSDVSDFRAASGLPPALLQTILVPGTGDPVVTLTLGEASLDVEWAGGVAKGATVIYVYTGNSLNYSAFDALQYAVDNDVAPIISISYGGCEQGAAQWALTMRQWAQQANSQGQTISAPAGDWGAADCDAAIPASNGLAVHLPASIPEVTGVGGTEFLAGTSTATYWSSSNNTFNGSALQYIPEEVWNETAADGAPAAGGGGASTIFTKPSWQIGLGVPNDGQRDVPDIALNATLYLICAQGSCVNGYQNAYGGFASVGGTSCGAPSFAGVLAIILQAKNLPAVGNVNPILYELASSSPSSFHTISTGNNIVPCEPGSVDCPNAPPYQFGFSAGAGYSQAAGLGSLDVASLANSWPGAQTGATDQLTVILGTGQGSVTGGGISCATGSTNGCSAAISSMTTMTLTATPATGMAFAGWAGACRGTSNTCQVTMIAPESVTANFQPGYPITASISGTGTGSVSGGGLSCSAASPNGCSIMAVAGTTVTLTATPAPGSVFTGWGGTCSGTNPSCHVTMMGAMSVNAVFQTAYQLTVAEIGTGAGLVSGNGITCTSGSTTGCNVEVAAPAAVTLTATPASGSVFSGWGGACSGSSPTCQLMMTGAVSVQAIFQATYLLSATIIGAGSGTVSGGGISCDRAVAFCEATETDGSVVTLTATPAVGSAFAGWGGPCSGTSATCEVTVTAAESVFAIFQPADQLNATTTGSGAGSVSGSGLTCASGSTSGCSVVLAAGTAVTLTAEASLGSTFAGWGGACSGTSSTCQLTVTGAVSVTAEFDAPAQANASGGCRVCGGAEEGYLAAFGIALTLRPLRRRQVKVRLSTLVASRPRA